MTSETELIKQLDAENLSRYLKANGWEEKASKYHRGVVNWRLFDTSKQVHIVSVIWDKSYGDYELRHWETVNELSKIMQKDISTICNEILDYSKDVMKFHIHDPEAPMGTLSLDYGAKTVPVPTGVCNNVSLSSEEITYMADSAVKYRKQQPEPLSSDSTVQGYVYSLTRKENGKTGTVRMNVKISGKDCQVKIVLPCCGDENGYNTAVTAHINGSLLSCTGTLIEKGKMYQLTNPQTIKIIEQTE